ncbi:hypothetical protein BL250_14105 [Erwinia sp. OLTSP20]|uniref:flagellar protein FliT n=1 Tax=unclassified Erwinia TaxID=2622719 RepID=UPI000C17A6FC|nr:MULTISPECIES: flagellar protein FliT [unclassified Erwinia]PIJ48337.1 hypothetical protein BV501_17465 [Erwinia sp. OAMSP11]PIJ68690.1 hypothetical protein BK416_16190 [Erwinia sp. OLSSP12]PIJ78838.1 hypothetical protein BLD47_16410 [Erwinia sp. OLCASP19]PIJ79808.1 hypothetical protein BLD46_16530 [Erwinia sp. OLMTSP26]PIJ81213.1 hypothetical protein BLD49_16665 [Erwinia sp. OLMDSP33]
MTIAPQLLQNYQTLLSLSQKMLRLANEEKWHELVEVEAGYTSTITMLAHCTRDHSLSLKSLEPLRPLLRHLLDNEREIKQLLLLRKNELHRLITQSQRQQSLMSAYTENAGQLLVPRDI